MKEHETSKTYLAELSARGDLGIAARAAGLRWKPEYTAALAACEKAILKGDPEPVRETTEKFFEVAGRCGMEWTQSVQDALDAYLYAVHENGGRGVDGAEPAPDEEAAS